ncbi:MAG: MBL fold metallo-hydrolase [Verrucomicrobiia bacterium]
MKSPRNADKEELGITFPISAANNILYLPASKPLIRNLYKFFVSGILVRFQLHPEEISEGQFFEIHHIQQWINQKPEDFATAFHTIFHKFLTACDHSSTVWLKNMVRLTILGSGSAGNCALVEADQTRLLIDAGLSGRQIQNRLSQLGKSLDEIDGVLLTHEHSDHTLGLTRICQKRNIPIYTNSLTAECIKSKLNPSQT